MVAVFVQWTWSIFLDLASKLFVGFWFRQNYHWTMHTFLNFVFSKGYSNYLLLFPHKVNTFVRERTFMFYFSQWFCYTVVAKCVV